MVYALDTNIIIHYLRDNPNVHSNLNDAVTRGDSLVIPKIVDYELKRGFRVQHAPKKEAAYGILTDPAGWCAVDEMDEYSWERAEHIYSDLYNKRLTIEELDILIAALCIERGYTLVTNNAKHFQNVDGLLIVDWTSL
jgi:tRNA(fMet)-specific endonuclease VapC